MRGDPIEDSLRSSLGLTTELKVLDFRSLPGSQRVIFHYKDGNTDYLAAAYRKLSKDGIASDWFIPEVEILRNNGLDSWEEFKRPYMSTPDAGDVIEFRDWVGVWEPFRP